MFVKLYPCFRVMRACSFLLTAFILLNANKTAAQAIEPPGFTLDFEQGTLRGWKSTGRAFANQPTLGDNPIAGDRLQSANIQGRYWIGTYENYQGQPGQQRGAIQGDKPTGVLTSAPFTIPEGMLSFYIGGSSGFNTRVVLDKLDPIEGRIRAQYASGKDRETMEKVEWDLSQYAGARGQLRIVDESTDGHINVDAFNFSYFQPSHHLQNHAVMPEAPEVFNQPGLLIQPTIELRVTKNPVRVGDNTILAALLRPGNSTAIYDFHFGNGEETGWTQNPRISYGYNSPGQYEAYVEARPNPDVNMIRSKPVIINVTSPDVDVLLKADKTDVLVHESIQFSGRADNDSPDLVIYFGDDDATALNGPTVNHSYSQPGTYTVQLAAYLSGRLVGSKSITINVGAPSLELAASNLFTAIHDPVTFSARLNPPQPGFSYVFHPGDDTARIPMNAPEIEYRFSTSGTYWVYVVARGPNGEVSLKSDPLSVTVVKVSLTADKRDIGVGEKVRFTGSVNPSLDNADYIFSVGDSMFSRSQPVFEHAFQQTGEYKVRFTALVNGVNISSDPYLITVRSGLNLILDLDSNEAGTGDAVQFTASGVPPGVNVEYNFHFGDGSESGWQAGGGSIHSYDEKGPYDAFVEARLLSNEVLKSGLVRINIGGFSGWIVVIAALVVLGIGGYLMATGRMLSGSGKGSANSGPAALTIEPHIDAGRQEVASGSQFEFGTEIGFRPVKDMGKQSIENADKLIINERKPYESSS